MITSCLHCRERIRDCTAYRYVHEGWRVPVTGWYHTGSGRERCEHGGMIAWPQSLVAIRCRMHPRPASTCPLCQAASEISLHFHNENRCIPRLCYWVHVH